jgi:hypothetical protein
MMIWCEKYKIYVETKWSDNCPSCIFYRQKEDEDGHFYLVCDFNNWIPGLKRGKDESTN